MSLPAWATPKPSIEFSQFANDYGCLGSYQITANITTIAVGDTVCFNVASSANVETLTYRVDPYGVSGTPTPSPGPSSGIIISPTTSSGSITLAGGAQTTTGSFTVTNPSNSGILTANLTVQNTSRPSAGSTTLSISAFTLTPGQSQVIAFTCTSPSTHTGAAYTYTFGAVLDTGGGYPTHTHTQNF